MTERGAEARLRAQIVSACREMNASGLNRGTSGNVSARHGDGVLITPSGMACDAMRAQDIVEIDIDGRSSGRRVPSSEWRMHAAIYRARPEAGAVVHTHSDHAAALSALRRDIPAFHYMVAEFGGDSLRCADYATFGTEALSDAMMRALDGRRACLLANHGQICFARSLDAALDLAAAVETLCRQYAIALSAGSPVILGEGEMAEVVARFADYGQKSR